MSALAEMPRGPVFREKSGTRDDTDNYVSRIQYWRQAAERQALQELNASREWGNIAKYIDAIEGNQWGRDRPKYRSQFVDNVIARARQDNLSSLTDIRPTIDISSRVDAYKDAANMLNGVIHSEWTSRSMDISLVQVVDHSMLSTGFAKLGANGGQLSFTAHGMDAVLPINCGMDLQSSSAVLYRTYKPLTYFKTKFGDMAKGIETSKTATGYGTTNTLQGNQRPGQITDYQWNSFSPAMKRMMRDRVGKNGFQDGTNPFPSAELQEFWVEDMETNESQQDVIVKDPFLNTGHHNYWYTVKHGERLWPRKRLIVFGGEKPMYDGPSPYWHGRFPFGMLTLNPVVWAPRGLSKYRTLLPLQNAMNEISAGIMDNLKKALNQTVISRRGAINDADWERFYPDKPGQKLRINPTGSIADVKYIDAPVLPSYVFEFLKSLAPEFDRHAGTLDVNSLQKKKQVPGGDAIEQMRDMQTGQFRLEGRYVEVFLRDCGEQAVSNILQYFTSKQRLRMLGPDGLTFSDFDWDPNSAVPANQDKFNHWRSFPITIAAGSSHGSAKAQMKQLALILNQRQIIGARELLRAVEYPNADHVLQERVQEMQAMAKMQQEQGGEGQHPPAQGRTPRTAGQKKGKQV